MSTAEELTLGFHELTQSLPTHYSAGAPPLIDIVSASLADTHSPLLIAEDRSR